MNLLENFTAAEIAIIKQCLVAAYKGPFFPDWEFPILTGYTKQEVERVAQVWLDTPDDQEKEFMSMIRVCLGSLLIYPHDEQQAWQHYIKASYQEVNVIWEKLYSMKKNKKNGKMTPLDKLC